MMELLPVFDSWAARSVEEWVASIPAQAERIEETVATNEELTTNDDQAGMSRKKGMFFGRSNNAAEIYQMAQAARKLRDRKASRTSVVSKGDAPGEKATISERAAMLRSAYAAQRLDRMNLLHHGNGPSAQPAGIQSDGTVSLSFDSSNLDGFFGVGGYEPFTEGDVDDEDEYPAEQLLLNLGFGGPPQGLERVPERFLQPSQMRGVDLEKLLVQEQELDETIDSALGYRGLSGPATRRPSSIVARLQERMREQQKSSSESRRKSSGQPSNFTSFEHPPASAGQPASASSQEGLVLHMHQEEEGSPLLQLAEESETEPGISMQASSVCIVAQSEGRLSSLASSRRSSLKRQERVEDDNDDDPEITLSVLNQSVPERSVELAGIIGHPLSGYLMGPAVYVTPPASVAGVPVSSSSALSGSVLVHPQEADPIFAVLQLAAEAYRVRLEQSPVTSPTAAESDWNHNVKELDAVKEELRGELARTDELLARLRDRLSIGPACHSVSNIRSVLDDMTSLLQHQRDLHRRFDVRQQQQHQEDDKRPRPGSRTESAAAEGGADTSPSSPSSPATNEPEEDHNIRFQLVVLDRFERHLTARIRTVIRREIRNLLRHSPKKKRIHKSVHRA